MLRMSDAYRVQMQTIGAGPTAVGTAGPFTVVAYRPAGVGGGGLGFNGGQLLNLAVAACISNDLYREAAERGLTLRGVRVTVDSDYVGDPAVATEIGYDVAVDCASEEEEAVAALIAYVDEIAEIPNSLRGSTRVSLRHRSVRATG
jgi:organic hydroperoxide reductase OsmC/OhrA